MYASFKNHVFKVRLLLGSVTVKRWTLGDSIQFYRGLEAFTNREDTETKALDDQGFIKCLL